MSFNNYAYRSAHYGDFIPWYESQYKKINMDGLLINKIEYRQKLNTIFHTECCWNKTINCVLIYSKFSQQTNWIMHGNDIDELNIDYSI